MKIALAQLNFIIADIDGNSRKIIDTIEQAKSQDADLVVFSELAVCGYPPDDLLDYPHFIRSCEEGLMKIAASCMGIAAIVGCPVINTHDKGRRLFNAACVLKDGKVLDIIEKTLLPTYDVFNETRYFEQNDSFNPVDLEGNRIGISICEDLWHHMESFSYKTNPLKELAAFHPDIMINISASPFNKGKVRERYEIIEREVKAHGLPMVYVNQVGVHTDLIFDGNSMVVNGDGTIALQLPAFEEAIAYYDTAAAQTHKPLETLGDIESLHRALVFGTREYFSKMGFTKAVLGSSGGIDSAVVQALASEAIGAENVTALLMPSEFSTEGSIADAKALSGTLGNPYHIISIKDIYNSFGAALKPVFGDLPFNLAEENMQARSRAILLMAMSNKFGNILLNTSNKSEMSVGYTTLYGDMCGSLSLIGDVYKTEVYELARYINRDKEIIPAEIIEKAPSAELRPGQKDIDSLPEYDILDGILELYIEERLGPHDIIAKGFEPQLVERVIRMVNNNEFKRFQAPPILRVSHKAFGRGRIIPLVMRWKV